MQRSTDRILTTHVGSLVRPMSIRSIMTARDFGQPYDEAAYQKTLRDEVTSPGGTALSAVDSCFWPAVKWKWSGCPRPSHSKWIFVEKPPRERPNA